MIADMLVGVGLILFIYITMHFRFFELSVPDSQMRKRGAEIIPDGVVDIKSQPAKHSPLPTWALNLNGTNYLPIIGRYNLQHSFPQLIGLKRYANVEPAFCK